MKEIHNYIIEKLKLNKNSKILSSELDTIVEKIIKWLIIPTTIINEVEKLIKDWVLENNILNINDLEPCADKETLNDHLLNNTKQKQYNSDDSMNEKCQYELDKAKSIYHNKQFLMDIYITNKMICSITMFGTIYIIVKSEFK